MIWAVAVTVIIFIGSMWFVAYEAITFDPKK